MADSAVVANRNPAAGGRTVGRRADQGRTAAGVRNEVKVIIPIVALPIVALGVVGISLSVARGGMRRGAVSADRTGRAPAMAGREVAAVDRRVTARRQPRRGINRTSRVQTSRTMWT